MSEVIREPFCPIYREAREAAPWKNAPSAHAGLLFDKFADAWRFNPNRNGNGQVPEFDKGDGHRKHGAGEWLNRFRRSCGHPELINEACRRQRQLVASQGGQILLLRNTARFVTGMGRQHPLENGFVWHPTLGVPYLPGSSLKGMLRAWIREETGDLEIDKRNQHRWNESEQTELHYGTQKHAGGLILLDMLPTEPPQLTVDVMTPHYGPYYQEDKAPGDWHSPIPISFLAVEEGKTWQVGVLPREQRQPITPRELQEVCNCVFQAFEWMGAGAKTAVGYGRFERDVAGEQKIQQDMDDERRRMQERQDKANADAEFRKSLLNNSPQLQKLKQLQQSQDWSLNAGNPNILTALNQFAEQNLQPPQDCLDWIKELLESIPNYKGVWDDPNNKKGKPGKEKFKYSAAAIRNLVNKLNPK